MSEGTKSLPETHPTVSTTNERRRSRRLPVQIPVVLRGSDASGRRFFDRTEVVSLDERGARVRTRFLLNPGAVISVRLETEDGAKAMRVVWRGEPGSFYEGMVGMEFVEPTDGWKLESLRARWGARKF